MPIFNSIERTVFVKKKESTKENFNKAKKTGGAVRKKNSIYAQFEWKLAFNFFLAVNGKVIKFLVKLLCRRCFLHLLDYTAIFSLFS